MKKILTFFLVLIFINCDFTTNKPSSNSTSEQLAPTKAKEFRYGDGIYVQRELWDELRNNPLNPYGYKFFEHTQLKDAYGNNNGVSKKLKYGFKVSQSYYDAIQKFPNIDAWWGGRATPLGNKMVDQIVEHQNNCNRTPGYVGGYGACPDFKLLKL
jgi:hypothetical protein